MKKLYKIDGYCGEHDEAGAVIVEVSTGKKVLWTPGITANTKEGWKAYNAFNEFVLNALNGHVALVEALKSYHAKAVFLQPEIGAPVMAEAKEALWMAGTTEKS